MSGSLNLNVEESPVTMGGRARINKNNLAKLGIKEGSLVVLSSEEKDILVNIYSDQLVDEGSVVIRKEDMKKLITAEGCSVKVRPHSKVLKSKPLDKLL